VSLEVVGGSPGTIPSLLLDASLRQGDARSDELAGTLFVFYYGAIFKTRENSIGFEPLHIHVQGADFKWFW